MNYSAILYILGWILQFEGIFLILPCLTAVIYREEAGFSFLAVMIGALLVGFLLRKLGKKDTAFYAKEGFAAVALSWIVLSAVGALPFTLCGAIPSYVDALFETVSGFTTTGASILSDVESLPRCAILWRSFTHWIGGMGVFVFILAILPMAGGYNMHLMRAESPGPQVGKLVPRMRTTAMTLYSIYVVMTIIQIILLLLGGMPLFDALNITFGTAGTGGFAIKNDSMAGYSTYLQAVITIFMILFGVNFNVYYLMLIRKGKEALKNDEVKGYFVIILAAALVITFNIRDSFENILMAFHHALFQVASIITTTGYVTTDFELWPMASKTILILLMFVGACAGSTGGGIKVSRVLIALKQIKKEIYSFVHPRAVRRIKLDGRTVDNTVMTSVMIYISIYFVIFAGSLLLVSFSNYDFMTNFTAVATTFNNVGPGLSLVGPTCNLGFFNDFTKFVFIFNMLTGRLEILPMIVLFNPRTWKK